MRHHQSTPIVNRRRRSTRILITQSQFNNLDRVGVASAKDDSITFLSTFYLYLWSEHRASARVRRTARIWHGGRFRSSIHRFQKPTKSYTAISRLAGRHSSILPWLCARLQHSKTDQTNPNGQRIVPSLYADVVRKHFTKHCALNASCSQLGIQRL